MGKDYIPDLVKSRLNLNSDGGTVMTKPLDVRLICRLVQMRSKHGGVGPSERSHEEARGGVTSNRSGEAQTYS